MDPNEVLGLFEAALPGTYVVELANAGEPAMISIRESSEQEVGVSLYLTGSLLTQLDPDGIESTCRLIERVFEQRRKREFTNAPL